MPEEYNPGGYSNQETDEIRRLVTIDKVTNLRPIPDADSIEQVNVRGWNIVTKIGEFKEGDQCVYFEIDSLLPVDDERFAFLAPRGTRNVNDRLYHRLKTAKLREVYSQGLALPLSLFPELAEDVSDVPIAQRLGIIKYEPPAILSGGDIKGAFPAYLGQKSDAERVQNLVGVWDAVVAAGPYVPTEKIDGMSMSVFMDEEGDMRVCGRNYEITEGDNIYWRAMRTYSIDSWLKKGQGVQCELYGAGVQRNPLKVNGLHIAVFNFIDSRSYLPRSMWPDEVLAYAVPTLDLEMPATVEDAISQAEGLQSKVAPGQSAEGIVWHQAEGIKVPELGYRPTWKAVNNRYLLKHE